MYFKQIDLQGFKSFADRTQFALDHGITAVVGPNGCGKSNILDALRWALGEQSAKALRGAHMQDVIFNGSEHRPAMGMAEVSLTFDNADARLPVDFAEVEVTRRVYRSGESEYLLNKAPCRLRDIQELFMDTGIGTNAYSLIGQGKIDMVLSSRPEDRRFLFEEAAGIIKYKSRKRTALRKLERADQNLLRLTDIIHEVERQMRSLKRQVNAAIRHRELTDALRGLEIRNAWLQYNELTGQIEDLKERFGRASKDYEKASTETEQKEATLEEVNLKRIELERMLMARREGEHKVDSEMERIESAIALLRQQIGFAKEQEEQALEEHREYTERAKAALESRGETGARGEQLQSEAQAGRNALSEKQQEYEALSQRAAAADEAVEGLRARALDTINSRNRTQTELETITVSITNIDTQLETIYASQESQNSRQETLANELDTARKAQSEAQAKLTATVTERQESQKKRGDLSERMQKLNDEWQQLRETKSSQEARLNSLRELRDSYEGFATGVRAIMMAKQRNMAETDGVIGPVGDLLSTDKAYEQAIEAALGGNINNVVVNQAEAAKSAIAFLKQHRAGRVTFLPLDTIRSSSHDDSHQVHGQPGVIGKAINYVQCDAQILPAIEYLLYNTIIVETIDDAIRIARAERRFPRLVTLDGEVVSSAGAVTGGRTKSDNRGLLGRSAEIDELETKVSEAEKRIKRIGGEAQGVTVEIQSLAQRIRELEEVESVHRNEVNEVGVSTAKLSTELDNLTQSGRSLSEQRNALQEQRSTLETRREEAQVRVSSMEDGEQALQRESAEAQKQASEARQALSACGDELSDLRVRLAELAQSVEEAARASDREQREHEALLREADRRTEMAQESKLRQADLEEQIAGQVERSKALSETKEEAHGKVLEAQKEQQEVIDQSEALNEALKELRKQSADLQKEVHGLELDLSHPRRPRRVFPRTYFGRLQPRPQRPHRKRSRYRRIRRGRARKTHRRTPQILAAPRSRQLGRHRGI